MKITPEHRAYMRRAIHTRLATYPKDALASYLHAIQSDSRVDDWQKRYRWDLAYASGLIPWFCSNIYPYANDTHIDTALKTIMTELQTNTKGDAT